MDFLLRIPVAIVGLLLVRGFIYPRGWAGRRIGSALLAIIGAAMVLPLASYDSLGAVAALGLTVITLVPYRQLAIGFLKMRTRAGLRALADEWGTILDEDAETGRWDVEREVEGRRTWVGNVLTHKGSIDPNVRRKEVGYMLAFVIELDEEPPFLVSLMFGWDKPRYFEREWRATHVIHGEYLSLPFGDIGLERDRGRATGGAIDRLVQLASVDARGDGKLMALGTDASAFARLFDADLQRAFARVSSQTYPYELNVTPTSVNIYTTYCPGEVQNENVRFLERLARRLAGEAALG
jgi:hypothetical protein